MGRKVIFNYYTAIIINHCIMDWFHNILKTKNIRPCVNPGIFLKLIIHVRIPLLNFVSFMPILTLFKKSRKTMCGLGIVFSSSFACICPVKFNDTNLIVSCLYVDSSYTHIFPFLSMFFLWHYSTQWYLIMTIYILRCGKSPYVVNMF